MNATPVDAEDDARAESPTSFLPLVVCVAGILILPFVVATFLPASAAGWSVLGIFTVLTLACGAWFGALTTPTWWFPVGVGVAFWIAKALYFQDGTFLYSVLFALLAGFGTLITGHNKLDLDDEEEIEGEPAGEVERGDMDA